MPERRYERFKRVPKEDMKDFFFLDKKKQN